jgi:competence protein ComEC
MTDRTILDTEAEAPAEIAAHPPRRPVAAWLGAGLAGDRDRWPLWLPVAAGLGVAGYFGLSREPEPWAGGVLAALTLGLLLRWRNQVGAGALALTLFAMAAGFAAAQARTLWLDTAMLADEVGPLRLAGTVAAVDRRPEGLRVVLDGVTAAAADEAIELPPTVRVRLAGSRGLDPIPGDRLAVPAVLLPPRGPVAPGAFDFRRRAFFEGLGAVGYAIGPAERLAPAQSWAAQSMARVRDRTTRRVNEAVGGAAGAVAAALLTGDRAAIPDWVYEAMRDSGLAHLLAISGLHVGLVAGIVFFAVRAGLALDERLALRRPIKKWAALSALLAAGAYTLMVGAPVPTQRAFLMTGLVLVAVLADREAVSMRLVAIAAAVILAIRPESLTGPSFQMSFAAVTALVATYERLAGPATRWRANAGWAAMPLLYLGGVALTTVIASLATAPFAAFHFQRLATYGVVANLAAVPLTAFWIMPWGLAAFALLPLGLEELALRPMGWGLDALLWIARTAAGWPGAALSVPAMPGWGLGLIALGGLWLCLWRQAWRYFGLFAVALGIAGLWLTPRPDILVNGDARLMAVRDGEGRLLLSSTRVEQFAADIWLRRDGRETAEPWPESGEASPGLRCDSLGCLYQRGSLAIALLRDPLAMAEDCRRADLVIAPVPVPRGCATRLVIDRFDVWRHGAHALYVDGDWVHIETVADHVGDRPWAVQR